MDIEELDKRIWDKIKELRMIKPEDFPYDVQRTKDMIDNKIDALTWVSELLDAMED